MKEAGHANIRIEIILVSKEMPAPSSYSEQKQLKTGFCNLGLQYWDLA